MASGTFYPVAESNKLEWVLQFLDERKAQNGKVVIATGFTKLANLFADEIRRAGWKVLTLTGETSGRQRDHAQDEFQNGSTRVIVINMFAGGEAIDLSAADELVALDDPWTDDTRQQYENRIVNLSKTNQLTIFHLRSEGTVEADIAEMNDDQRAALMSAKPKAKALKEVLTI
jgi:SNF2 family DNA or RNA helicase